MKFWLVERIDACKFDELGADVWTDPEKSTCKVVGVEGKPEVIILEYRG